MIKPLGRKAYGSIPHLPQSRMGPGDHHCHEGQARIATAKARDKRDEVIVQEKLDGSNCTVANIDGKIVALGRSGYLASASQYEQHQLFSFWVRKNEDAFRDALRPGERFAGEWLAQAHGTRYELTHDPYVVFDLFSEENQRVSHDELTVRAKLFGFEQPKTLHRGDPISVSRAMKIAGDYGCHGAIDPIEGVMYRVERDGKFDFLAKYVRPSKVDGRFLPENNNGEAIWNWRP